MKNYALLDQTVGAQVELANEFLEVNRKLRLAELENSKEQKLYKEQAKQYDKWIKQANNLVQTYEKENKIFQTHTPNNTSIWHESIDIWKVIDQNPEIAKKIYDKPSLDDYQNLAAVLAEEQGDEAIWLVEKTFPEYFWLRKEYTENLVKAYTLFNNNIIHANGNLTEYGEKLVGKLREEAKNYKELSGLHNNFASDIAGISGNPLLLPAALFSIITSSKYEREAGDKEEQAKELEGRVEELTADLQKEEQSWIRSNAAKALGMTGLCIGAFAGASAFLGSLGSKEISKSPEKAFGDSSDTIIESIGTRGDELPEPIPICTAKNGQQDPRIYGDNIVWYDDRNERADIYAYNLNTGKEIRVNSVQEYNRYASDMYAGKAVWQDARNGEDFDIYMYDLSTGKETRITIDSSDQEFPKIYGDKIVWRDGRDEYCGDIYIYDLTTKKEARITNGTWEWNLGIPDIYGDKIVWDKESDWDTGSDIYLYDLATEKETKITTNSSDQRGPAIYKNKIVWVDDRNGDDSYGCEDIYMYDLTTKKEARITRKSRHILGSSDIYGDKIIWDELKEENDAWKICMYDLSKQEEVQIGLGRDPAIYGDRIVFEKYVDGDYHIYLLDLSGQLQPTEPSTWTPSDVTLEEICKLEERPDEILKASSTKYRIRSDIKVEIAKNQDKIEGVQLKLHYDHGKLGKQEDKTIDLDEIAAGVYLGTVEDTTASSLVKSALGKTGAFTLPIIIAELGNQTPTVTIENVKINNQNIDVDDIIRDNPYVTNDDKVLDKASDGLSKLGLLQNCMEVIVSYASGLTRGGECPVDIIVRDNKGNDITNSSDVLYSGPHSDPEIAIFQNKEFSIRGTKDEPYDIRHRVIRDSRVEYSKLKQNLEAKSGEKYTSIELFPEAPELEDLVKKEKVDSDNPTPAFGSGALALAVFIKYLFSRRSKRKED